jgi:pimeloyl-ACP methyl ester carboxylesterase
MYVECRGAGKPTVLLEAGLRTRGDVWSSTALLPAKAKPAMAGVAAFTRVCEYDRPGTTLGTAPKDYSRSDPVPMPRSARDAMKDLHALLRVAKIPGPYVLVGHSFGGQIIRQYAATYPRDVVGLVLVDVLPEQLRPLMTVANWKTYLGLNSKPPHGLEQYKQIEVEDFDLSFAQTLSAVAASPLRAMPIVVLSKGRPFDLAGANVPAGFEKTLDSDWSKAQVQLVAALPDARHVVVADSSHNIEIDRPDLVLRAIRQVVEAVRAGRDRVDEAR